MRAVLAVAQMRDQRGDEREQDAEHERRGDDVAQLGAVLEEHERIDALDQPGDARADERADQREDRRRHDVAEDAPLEAAVAEPRRQARPDQRQHHEVEQDRRFGERHVPREVATRSTRRTW